MEIKKVYYFEMVEDGELTNFGLTYDINEAQQRGNNWGLASIDDLFLSLEQDIVFKDAFVHVIEGVYKCTERENLDGRYYDYELIEEILDEKILDKRVVEKIKEVNDYFKNLGMEDRIHTTTIEKKLLTHANWLDFENNKFCGTIEFRNLKQIEIANYLCSDDKSYAVFINRFIDLQDIWKSIIKFRKYLRDEIGRGQNINADTLKKLIDRDDYTALKDVLSELWLLPIKDY